MKQILPLVTSSVTVYNMYLAGNKDHRAWILGLLNQILWLAFIISFGAWGLLPLTIALTFMYARNLRKWKCEQVYPPVEMKLEIEEGY